MGLAYFGKLSSRADFIRHNATGSVFRAFDDWIQGGLRLAAAKQYADFERSYDSAGPSCFLYQPSAGSSPLVGAIRPSRDRAGRKYPFFIAAEPQSFDMQGAPTAALPFRFAPLFDNAVSLIDDAIEARITSEQLTDQIQTSSQIELPQQNSSEAYAASLREITFGDFCRKIWGTFFDTRKYAAFKNLLDLLLPLKGKGHPQFSYGLQFPLAEGTLLSASVSFWLEACARLLSLPLVRPTLFWNVRNGTDGSTPSLFVYFSQVPSSAFMHIAQLDIDIDTLYVIDGAGNRNPTELVLSIPEHYGRLIESEGLSLWKVLQGLESDT